MVRALLPVLLAVGALLLLGLLLPAMWPPAAERASDQEPPPDAAADPAPPEAQEPAPPPPGQPPGDQPPGPEHQPTGTAAPFVEVALVDDAYEPAAASVPQGTSVRFLNRGNGTHSVTGGGADGGDPRIDQVLGPGQTAEVRWPAGDYRLWCKYHSRMQATLSVTA